MNRQTKGIVYVFLAALLFSTGGLFVKLVPWSPLAINGVRNLIALMVFGLYLKATKHTLVINKAVLFGAVCMAGTTTLYCLANKLTTAANAIVLQFTAPVFVILFMWVLFRETPKKPDMMACFFVFAGILFFFIDGLSSGHMLGNIVAALSGVCYAGVFMMNSFPDSDSQSSIFFGQVISAVTCCWFVTGETDFGMAAVGGILVLGIFQVAVAYIFMAKGLENTPAVTASLTTAIEPILNPILVALFFHEAVTPLSLIGAVIVVGTVVLYNVAKAKKQNEA